MFWLTWRLGEVTWKSDLLFFSLSFDRFFNTINVPPVLQSSSRHRLVVALDSLYGNEREKMLMNAHESHREILTDRTCS